MDIDGRNLYDLKIHINDPELYTENSIKKKEFDIRFKNSASVEYLVKQRSRHLFQSM